MQMTNPQVRYPRDLNQEKNISWTAAFLIAAIIVLSAVPFGLIADWLKPVNLLMSILPTG